MRILVNDLPILGEMLVRNASDKQVLYRTYEDGDIPPDVALLEVVQMYAEDGKIIVEV